MKRLITFFLVLVSLIFPSSIFAQTSGSGSSGIAAPDMFPIPVPGNPPNFLGQNHSYSVVFRGNGEAVVSAKIVFTNLEKAPQSELTLQFPKINPTDITTYQVIKEPICVRYGNGANPTCLAYQDPDYFQAYWGNSKYLPATYDLKGDNLKVTLSNPVSSQKSGAIFVYFRAFGFAKRDLYGAFNYTFETLKVTDKIRDLQVGISTDSDLILKNATGNVDYRVDEAVTSLKAAPQAAAGISNAQFDSFYNQIGQGSIVKTASNLAASETYKVSGAYADTQIKLFAGDIIKWVGIALIILVIILIFGVVVYRITKKSRVVLTLGLSLLSTVLAAIYTGIIIFIFRYFGQSNAFTLLMLLMAVFSTIAYSVFIFGPAIYVGMKFGVKYGILNVGATLFLIFFIVGIVIAIILSMPNTQSSPIIYPMLRGTTPSVEGAPLAK